MVSSWRCMMSDNNLQLIQKILNGEEEAFSTLIHKYQKRVHALAWRKLGDYHLAEDITQDTFIQVYQNLSTLKIITSLMVGFM